jgi:hypothetical protein
VLVSATDYVADGASNSGTDYATTLMTAADAPSPKVITCTQYYSTQYPYLAFNQSSGGYWQTEGGADITSGAPTSIVYDSGDDAVKYRINKYRFYITSGTYAPKEWKLQGSDTGVYNNDANWTDLDTQTAQSPSTGWTSYYTFSNTTAYRKYRIRFTDTNSSDKKIMIVGEIHLVACSTGAGSAPTFTKATINYDTDVIPLDLRSNSWEASVNDPTAAYCVLDVEPVDAVTYNTDLLAYASNDNGATYQQVTLESTPFREIGVHDYIRGDLTGITWATPADKTIRIKVTTANSKALKLHAWAIGVKY